MTSSQCLALELLGHGRGVYVFGARALLRSLTPHILYFAKRRVQRGLRVIVDSQGMTVLKASGRLHYLRALWSDSTRQLGFCVYQNR